MRCSRSRLGEVFPIANHSRLLRERNAFLQSCCALLFSVFLIPLLSAAPPATTIQAVRRNPQSFSDPVRLRGIITSFSGWKNSFFLQDASDAISVDRLEDTPVHPGDEVELSGHLQPGSFAPIVTADAVSVIGHRHLPAPRQTTYDELSKAQLDSRLVEVSGIVRSAESSQVWGRRVLLLKLQAGGGVITIHVLDFAHRDFSNLVDSTVRVTGVCGTIFNNRRQFAGLRLFVSGLDQIEIVVPAVSISRLSLSPLTSLLRFDGPSLDHRVKVSGTVTYQVAPREFYLRQEDAAIRVLTADSGTWKIGSRVHAAGFVSSSRFMPVLRNAVVETSNLPAEPVEPLRIRAADALLTGDGFVQAPYNGRLVQLRAHLMEFDPASASPLLLLRDGAFQFQAQLPSTAALRRIAVEQGSDVAITGICLAELDDNQTPFAFRILLRSPDDIRPLNAPNSSSSILLLLSILTLILLGSFLLWLYHRRKNELVPDELGISLSDPWRIKCMFAARGLALLSACAGFLVIVGWRFDIPILQFGMAHRSVMPNSAAGFLAAGIALLFTRKDLFAIKNRRWPLILGWAGVVLCVAIGSLTLVEYAAALDLHVDRLLIRNIQSLPQVIAPGRIAVATALCLLLTSLAISLTNFKRSAGTGQVLALCATVIGLLDLMATVYGSRSGYGAGIHATMSSLSACIIVCLNLAVLCSSSDSGLMRTFLVHRGGGFMARRMLPVAIGGPILMGLLLLQGQIAGWYDTRFGLALLACSNVVCFGFLIWSCAEVLNRLEAERFRAETNLKERDQRLELVFSDASVGDFCWDAVHDQLTAHPVVWKLYGAPAHIGSEPADWFRQRQHPHDLPRIDAAMQSALAGTRRLDTEFRIILPDGSISWICCRAQLDCGPSGQLLRTVGINFDVTARKLAEQSVADSERRFRQLADAMPQIVWTLLDNGSVDYYNQRWYEYTGLSFEDPWDTVIHEEDIECLQAAVIHSRSAEFPLEAEFRIRRAADGAYRWHLARSIPIRDANGVIQRWFGTSTDIHDHKEATAELERLNRDLESRVQERSAALLESEQRHRSMIEGVTDYSIFMMDPVGRVSSWNAGAERNQQYTATEILGEHFSIFYPPDAVSARHPQHELEIAAHQGQYREEGWRVRKDGSQFWASVLITRIQGNEGTVRGFSKVVRDLTEQKMAEEAIRAEQRRAEEANRAKSEFLAAMSHEIRTPMNAILGMADLLWETDLGSTQRRYVEIFRRAGANLLTLVNDILDLSKIESGHFDLEQVSFDLEELVTRIVDLIRAKTGAKGLYIAASVSNAVAPDLVGDPARLQQVLLNLLGNAVKFTEKGWVSLCIDAASARPGHLSFKVTDTGIGIPADKLGKIFEDFTQAESSTTRRFGGTGLGLGICRRLVSYMGGELKVTSEYGNGSCFYFDATFGVSEETASSQSEATADLAGRSILILDHNPTTRMIFSDMCGHWGMRTAECADGPGALDLLHRAGQPGAAFDAVLVDRQAPGGGFYLIDRIRSQYPSLALIMTTSDDIPGEATRAKQLRLAGYIAKPVRRHDLLRLLCRAFAAKGSDVHPPPLRDVNGAHNGMLKHRILIAEDSEDNQFLVHAYLKDGPFDLVFAPNGEIAVQMYCSGAFDLVLMDMQMPIMDGLTATRRIRSYEQSQSKPPVAIIALTANALNSDVAACKAAGCSAHLSKPIAKTKLISAIERHLGCIQQDGCAGTEPVIDIPEGLEQAAKRYIASRQKDIEKMQNLLQVGDYDSIRVMGHNMKGTGSPYGFPAITQLGAEIEARSKEQDAGAVTTQLSRLAEYVTKAMQVLIT